MSVTSIREIISAHVPASFSNQAGPIVDQVAQALQEREVEMRGTLVRAGVNLGAQAREVEEILDTVDLGFVSAPAQADNRSQVEALIDTAVTTMQQIVADFGTKAAALLRS